GSLRPGLALWMLLASAAWAILALRQLSVSLDAERLLQSAGGEAESAQRRVQSRYALRWAWVAVFLLYGAGGVLQAKSLAWGLLVTLFGLLLPLALLSARGTVRRAGESLREARHLRP